MAITKPYTFQAGTKARAGEVNQDFDILYSEVNRIGTEILNIDVDIQDIESSKADVNGNATQRFQMANPEASYDGVNKTYLKNAIANVKDYISGYVITKDNDNTIIVSSGSCYDSNFTTILTSTGNITKENLTQSANATYYVYAISDDSGYNADVLITTSSVNPPLPSGFTLFRQIGNYTTDENNAILSITNNSSGYINIDIVFTKCMPDFQKGISKTANITHTATQPGWLQWHCYENDTEQTLKINNIVVASVRAAAAHDASSAGALVPVTIGDTYIATKDSLKFYPIRGDI